MLCIGQEGKQAQPGKLYDVTGIEGHPAWSLYRLTPGQELLPGLGAKQAPTHP